MAKQKYALKEHEHDKYAKDRYADSILDALIATWFIGVFIIIFVIGFLIFAHIKINNLEKQLQLEEYVEWWTGALCVFEKGEYSEEYNICYVNGMFCRAEFNDKWELVYGSLKCSEAKG